MSPFSSAEPGRLEVAVLTEGLPPVQFLVAHNDDWRFFKGTAAPQADWQTVEDAALGEAWATGPGGFGYGDSGIQGEATNLPDMRNGYTTFFIRQEFEVVDSPDPTSVLDLLIDYDDGFVAYLDGVEVHRENAPGVVGESVPYDETASGLHEASCCNAPTHAPRTFDLGPVGDRLAPGPHVLAIQGLNESPGSSDFHLSADLAVSVQPDVAAGRYLVISRLPDVTLTGTISDTAIETLSVNGEVAAFHAETGSWSNVVSLAEGMNRVVVEGRDGSGLLAANARLDVVRTDRVVEVGGPLSGEVTWSPADGTIVVVEDVQLLANARLTIWPGTVVMFAADAGIVADDAALRVEGTAEAPVYLLPADGSTPWGHLEATGGDGTLTVRHAEMVAGSLEVLAGATAQVEDSVLRDLSLSTPIIHSNRAGSVEVRRCHLTRYYETLFQYTPTRVEDCVFEELPSANSDGIDFDGAPAGSTIRRCTLRHGRETNSDAIDIGSGSIGVLIEGCRMYGFSDKGVSIGEESHGITVADCLIHDTGIGVEVKDGCTSVVSQSTIADCAVGFKLRIKTGSEGGHLTDSFNNILWGNTETLVLLDDSTIVARHSLLEGLPVAGQGNLEDDPRFLNSAEKDYRLPSGSPLRSAGSDGGPMGALLPVGAIGAPTQSRVEASALESGGFALRFAADPERRYLLQVAANVTGDWLTEAVFLPFVGDREVVAELPFGPGPRFFRVFSELRQ